MTNKRSLREVFHQGLGTSGPFSGFSCIRAFINSADKTVSRKALTIGGSGVATSNPIHAAYMSST